MPSSDPGSSGSGRAEIGDQEPAPSGTATLGFLDHPGADVDGDDIGALFQQPLCLRSGPAAGVQHGGTVQVAGYQCPESRPLQESVKWSFVSSR